MFSTKCWKFPVWIKVRIFSAGCMGNNPKANKNAMLYNVHSFYILHLNYLSSVYMYMFIPVSEVFACLFDSKFLSFICCCFFFIVARNIRYQMSSFNENSAFGLIKHTCVELLAYPCMTYIVCIAWMCACWVVESVLCLWLLFVLSGPYFVILTNCAGVLKLFCDVIQR